MVTPDEQGLVNYRHAFHAGNFADLVKHAALLALLDRMLQAQEPLTVVDTHAGAGIYDLTDPAQARSREAEAGVQRLLARDTPPPLQALARSVRLRNPGDAVETYPGSPALVLERLRPGDRLVAFELQPQVHERLTELLKGSAAEARAEDGFLGAAKAARMQGRLLVLIDPPFERADDYVRIAETVAGVLSANPKAVLLLWLPLKDLETLDAFVRRLEALKPPPRAAIAETRMRSLRDPLRMNGCVLVGIGAPSEFDQDLGAISNAVVESLGEPGGGSKVWRIGR